MRKSLQQFIKILLPIRQKWENLKIQYNGTHTTANKIFAQLQPQYIYNTQSKWRRPLIVAYICARHPTLIILNKNCLYLLIIMLTSSIKSFFDRCCEINFMFQLFVRLHVEYYKKVCKGESELHCSLWRIKSGK